MRRTISLAVVALITVSVIGCSDSYERQTSTLETLLLWVQMGSSKDYFLQKKSSISPDWDSIAIIYGYGDDYSACREVAELLMQKHYRAEFRCVPAN